MSTLPEGSVAHKTPSFPKPIFRERMAVLVRAKRVTDPLNDKVKACICGKDHRQTTPSVSSGSEHEAEEDSPCLFDLIYAFSDNGDDAGERSPEDQSDSDLDFTEPTNIIEELLNPPVIAGGDDSFRFILLSHISKAIDTFSCLIKNNKAVFRRNLMIFLRESGYDAGICKTKWPSSGGVTAGNYEFIDVIRSDKRYIVDVDFAGEFEIARPTIQYEQLLNILPRVYVGRSEELKQIVWLMCDAAKRSLKSRELHIPPWRNNRYMQAKWFGPYRRTVNQIPANASFPARLESFVVNCRSVGFDAVSDGNDRFSLLPATRTR